MTRPRLSNWPSTRSAVFLCRRRSSSPPKLPRVARAAPPTDIPESPNGSLGPASHQPLCGNSGKSEGRRPSTMPPSAPVAQFVGWILQSRLATWSKPRALTRTVMIEQRSSDSFSYLGNCFLNASMQPLPVAFCVMPPQPSCQKGSEPGPGPWPFRYARAVAPPEKLAP